MNHTPIYSTKDAARILHVSTSTIYELIRRGELKSYRVGRNLRFSQEDLDDYVKQSHRLPEEPGHTTDFFDPHLISDNVMPQNGLVIAGQDVILDVLSNHLRLRQIPACRAYMGSFESLLSLYQDNVQIATAHLWDYSTDTYNVPFAKYLLPGIPTATIRLLSRMQGFYVAKGNPKCIHSWQDLVREDVTLINREKGSGSRVLLDGKIQSCGLTPSDIRGYDTETASHLEIVKAIADKTADVGIGIEKFGMQTEGIEFVPLQKEHYDMVVKKDFLVSKEMDAIMQILHSEKFKKEVAHIPTYDLTDMGTVINS